MQQRWKHFSKDEQRYVGAGKSGASPLLDPYAQWAVLTSWRGFRSEMERQVAGSPIKVRVLAMAPTTEVLNEALDQPWLCVSPAYKNVIPGTQKFALCFTAELSANDLPKLGDLGLRWELSVPLRDAESVSEATANGFFGRDVDKTPFQARNIFTNVDSAGDEREKSSKSGGAIAVIDFGCPFLSNTFASAVGTQPRTRLRALWDQGSSPKSSGRSGYWPWQQPQCFLQGRELGAEALQRMYASMWNNAGVTIADEHAGYRGIDYLIAYDDPRRRIWFSTHGAHVLSVAGGSIDPLTGKADPDVKSTGTASNADLIFVQLPALTAADSSGSSLSANLLDGVRYVLDQCTPDAKIVINISYGSHAGPHNGKSLFEIALDELLEARTNNFAIVLGAGNSRLEQCHAKRSVRAHYPARLRFLLAPGDTTDTFIEFWYSRRDRKMPTLKVRLRSPSGDWSDWCEHGQKLERADETTGDVVAAAFSGTDAVTKTMILLAFAPTAQPADDVGALAEAGVWEVEVALANGASADDLVEFDAWVERDDPSGMDSTVQPHFIGLSENDQDNTLSSLSTGQHTIVAGGFRISDGLPAAYSSIGPQRGPKSSLPLIYAACEEDELQPNILAAAVRSGEGFRMNGTSVAAPVLSRRIYNLMQRQGTVSRKAWKQSLAQLANGKDPFLRPA